MKMRQFDLIELPTFEFKTQIIFLTKNRDIPNLSSATDYLSTQPFYSKNIYTLVYSSNNSFDSNYSTLWKMQIDPIIPSTVTFVYIIFHNGSTYLKLLKVSSHKSSLHHIHPFYQRFNQPIINFKIIHFWGWIDKNQLILHKQHAFCTFWFHCSSLIGNNGVRCT